MLPTNLEITISENHPKERLDIFLSQKLPELSRSQIQRLISEGSITINGQPTKSNHKIKPLEIISVYLPPPQKSEIAPEEIPLDIVYEDDDLIVINKSDEMVVHPAFGNRTGTLVNALLFHCTNLAGIGGVERPGIVHRLDKNTSGLMVVAKNDSTHRHLAQQFSERTIEREYRAIVWGQLKEKNGQISTHLARHPHDRTRICIVPEDRGRLAITNYLVLEEFHLFSFLKLKLETGRTHQIRVHMKQLGNPIFGDPTYNGRTKNLKEMNQSERKFVTELLKLQPYQTLHALTLGFIHPQKNQFMRFQRALPLRFQQILDSIKKFPV